MSLSSDDRKALYAKLCRQTGPLLSSRPFDINEVNDPEKVAFTILDGNSTVQIYVNPLHPMFTRDPDEARQREILAGVILHEMLHTTYTEPTYTSTYAQTLKYPGFYYTLSNIIEDETIEARACTLLLKNELFCLHRAIYECWHTSDPVKASDPSIEQIMSALIQFTDMGPLVPGSNLSDEAYSVLTKVLPKVFSAIWETPRTRARIALSVYMDLIPLLERDLIKDSDVSSYDKGQCAPSGKNGHADESKPDADEMNSSASNRAKARIAEAMAKAAKSSADSMPSDTEDESSGKDGSGSGEATSDKEDSNPGKSSSTVDKDNSDNPDKSTASSENETSSDESDNDSDENETDGGSSESTKNGDEPDSADTPESKSSENSESQEDKHSDVPSELLDTSVIAKSVRELEAEITFDRIDISEAPGIKVADRDPSDVKLGSCDEMREVKALDIPAISNVYGSKIQCRNTIMTGISRETLEAYRRVKRLYSSQIHSFSQKMKKIALEEESRSWEKRGSLHIGRYAETASTSVNIFSKKTQKDRRNGKILIMLDISGSMDGKKIVAARNALVCITEGLTSANIPVKVITFHNDYSSGGTRVIHNHYINYKGGLTNKASLMTIHAGGDNFDGYSIRYGVSNLLKERTDHTLMIVISDGQPACRYYGSMASGIADTKAAVVEAKRKTRVIGIGIDADLSVLKSFYKDTFVEMTDMSSLMTNLSRLIEKEVKAW